MSRHHFTQTAITKLYTLALNSIFTIPYNTNNYCVIVKKAYSKNIRKDLDSVNWNRLFDSKDINSEVTALSETILNVFCNYVPNKYITINNKDPAWMNEIIKSKIKTKNLFFNQYIQNGRLENDFVFLETLITEVNELMSSTKKLCY